MNRSLTLAALLLSLGMLVACENEGPAERAGEAIDDTADEIADTAEDACEELKDGVGADDTDC